jgi:Domain of unknown function (DUF1508)
MPIKKGKDEMSGKFELFKDKSGDIRWNLKAANGEIVASSQGTKPAPRPKRASSRSSTTRPRPR